MKYDNALWIGEREIAIDQPAYFIADIASSHDGELSRAKDLIWLAKEAGADAAKFQHFLAKDIVSDAGFKALGGQMAHQSSWGKSVFDVFAQYQTPREWTEALHAEAQKAGIEFMTTPYDFAALDMLNPYLRAYKIGSGDISWTQFISAVAAHSKPVFLATGAADMADVKRAVDAVLVHNRRLCLMQCNTNYTGDDGNFSHINLNVLKSYATAYPGLLLGLSDHTPGHSTVLGAVALGARVIEKHFTDDNNREGPDHGFSMNPKTWREMVTRTHELQAAMGDGVKRVQDNEQDSAVVQRRCLRAKRDLVKGHKLTAGDLEALRPKPVGAVEPFAQDKIQDKCLNRDLKAGDAIMWEHLL